MVYNRDRGNNKSLLGVNQIPSLKELVLCAIHEIEIAKYQGKPTKSLETFITTIINLSQDSLLCTLKEKKSSYWDLIDSISSAGIRTSEAPHLLEVLEVLLEAKQNDLLSQGSLKTNSNKDDLTQETQISEKSTLLEHKPSTKDQNLQYLLRKKPVFNSVNELLKIEGTENSLSNLRPYQTTKEKREEEVYYQPRTHESHKVVGETQDFLQTPNGKKQRQSIPMSEFAQSNIVYDSGFKYGSEVKARDRGHSSWLKRQQPNTPNKSSNRYFSRKVVLDSSEMQGVRGHSPFPRRVTDQELTNYPPLSGSHSKESSVILRKDTVTVLEDVDTSQSNAEYIRRTPNSRLFQSSSKSVGSTLSALTLSALTLSEPPVEVDIFPSLLNEINAKESPQISNRASKYVRIIKPHKGSVFILDGHKVFVDGSVEIGKIYDERSPLNTKKFQIGKLNFDYKFDFQPNDET